MINLTISFYEHPAAMPHIMMWENLMSQQKRIIKIENFDDNIKAYYIKTNDDTELLICIGTYLLEKIDVVKYINENFKFDKYLKMLMFGKISSIQLLEMKAINDTMSSL